jgi:carbon monoxide dehydrogenase subunit G
MRAADVRVAAGPDAAWAALVDPARLVLGVPGAAVPRGGDAVLRGSVRVHLAGVATDVRGVVRLVDADEDGREATFHARGRPAAGGAAMEATVRCRVTPEGDATRLVAEADVRGVPDGAVLADGVLEELARRLGDEARAPTPPASRSAGRRTVALAGAGALVAAALVGALVLRARR